MHVSGAAAIRAVILGNRLTQAGNFTQAPRMTIIAHNYDFMEYWL